MGRPTLHRHHHQAPSGADVAGGESDEDILF
jgi:hypothetical protein